MPKHLKAFYRSTIPLLNKQVFGLRGNSQNIQQQKQVAQTECPEIRMKQGQ